MSSAAARRPLIGSAVYNAAKAGAEMWVRTVKRKLAERGRPTWVTAVRPVFVLSNGTMIGIGLPPRNNESALRFGEMV
jgi:NAD(P)-dependent dehydrogenase (short-subunit alcohol dehydrogenase family)